MKKIAAIFLAAWLVFGLVGCDWADTQDADEDYASKSDLYKEGLKVVSVMEEMVRSQEYAQLMGSYGMDTIIEQVSDCDMDEPMVVYEIIPPETEKMIKLMASDDFKQTWEDMSPALQEQVKNRFSFSSLVTAQNGQTKGSSYMAFCASYTATRKMTGLSVRSDRVFVYVFDDGINIVVTYSESGYANGQFLFMEGLEDQDDAEDAFREMKCKIEKIRTP